MSDGPPTVNEARTTAYEMAFKRFEPMENSDGDQWVEQANLRGVGVDFVKDDENQFWAVDINLAAGYRHSGLEPTLYESVTGSLPGQ